MFIVLRYLIQETNVGKYFEIYSGFSKKSVTEVICSRGLRMS